MNFYFQKIYSTTEALTHLDQFIKFREGKFASPYFYRGVCRTLLSQHTDAIADYDWYLRASPGVASTSARLNKGNYVAVQLQQRDCLIFFSPLYSHFSGCIEGMAKCSG
jgi:hypothetical protein